VTCLFRSDSGLPTTRDLPAALTIPASRSSEPGGLRRVYRSILQRAIGTITQITTQEPIAALTFDDGPDPVWTPQLLSLLEAHGARATFFMVGSRAQRHRDVVRRVAAGGHAIGNHSWDHPSFPRIPASERRRQIRACGQALAPYGCRLFRPPYGHQTIETRFDALRAGYDVVTWSIETQDWETNAAQEIIERVDGRLRPGSIILFHDGLMDALDARYFDRGGTVEAVALLLQRFAGRMAFVTLPELLRRGRPHREYWVSKSTAENFNGLTNSI
jgi:peptidoglycan-N-acetylglucosamine deacetylase